MEATSESVKQADLQATLAAETLTGDIRDVLLGHVRTLTKPWEKLSEGEQQNIIWAIEKTAEDVVRRAVNVVANQGFPHMVVSTGKWSVNDGIKLEVTSSSTVDNISRLAEHKGGPAILVLTEVGEFFGQRAAAKAEPDQPSMDLDEGEERDARLKIELPGEPPAGKAPSRRARRTISETEAA